MPTDRFALKIQNKVSFKQLRVFDELENCKSSYIVKHFFCQHYDLADESKNESSDVLDEMFKDLFYSQDEDLGKIVAIGMENLDGEIFSNLTDADLNDALSYTIQVAGGLEWLHSREIIHRDIKPENIIINESENIVIYNRISFFNRSGQNN